VEDTDDIIPQKGYLNAVREDGRISTPAIEIGATSNRYRHITVANIPRATSIYGKEMRSLFGAGKDYFQIGFDFSSLENRVQGGYVRDYPFGEDLAVALLAEKPLDLHSLNAIKLGISRSDAKSFRYAILYKAFINKLAAMLNKSFDETKILYEEYWNSVPALKALKEDLTQEWIRNDKKYITGIDSRS
jgi:DNA polymerase I-like protein with 3'-5' exonuclease and polymerase domains